MIDMSHLPFEENIRESKRAAEYCHFYGIPVEVELGHFVEKKKTL
ncbi:MAG: class II fructose-bisphosphate aldolase [Lachnospiraceae bacterium]